MTFFTSFFPRKTTPFFGRRSFRPSSQNTGSPVVSYFFSVVVPLFILEDGLLGLLFKSFLALFAFRLGSLEACFLEVSFFFATSVSHSLQQEIDPDLSILPSPSLVNSVFLSVLVFLPIRPGVFRFDSMHSLLMYVSFYGLPLCCEVQFAFFLFVDPCLS